VVDLGQSKAAADLALASRLPLKLAPEAARPRLLHRPPTVSRHRIGLLYYEV
jgi:hypothetical protein